MGVYELFLLKWLHIVAMVYWLGGEWGVFQTSYNVVNHRLPLDERRRHMETAYRIDILARSGIILLLPLGLHMGHLWRVQPLGGAWLGLMWALALGWLALCWAAFIHRETDRGIRLTTLDERIRFVLIPLLATCALSSLAGFGPFGGEPGQRWYSAKLLIYAGLLVIGLLLRFIMREWTLLFRRLASEGSPPAVERQLERSIRFGRRIAYVYWVGIGTTAFLGVAKPF
jgi:hypothetical protein